MLRFDSTYCWCWIRVQHRHFLDSSLTARGLFRAAFTSFAVFCRWCETQITSSDPGQTRDNTCYDSVRITKEPAPSQRRATRGFQLQVFYSTAAIKRLYLPNDELIQRRVRTKRDRDPDDVEKIDGERERWTEACEVIDPKIRNSIRKTCSGDAWRDYSMTPCGRSFE